MFIRRLLRFRLRTLLVLMAIVAGVLAYNLHVVRERQLLRAEAEAAGWRFETYDDLWREEVADANFQNHLTPGLPYWEPLPMPERKYGGVSWLRRLMGDIGIFAIYQPHGDGEFIERCENQFPEAVFGWISVKRTDEDLTP